MVKYIFMKPRPRVIPHWSRRRVYSLEIRLPRIFGLFLRFILLGQLRGSFQMSLIGTEDPPTRLRYGTLEIRWSEEMKDN